MKNILIITVTLVIGVISVNCNAIEKKSSISFLTTYANIAIDNYNDALQDAQGMVNSINKFINQPTFSSMLKVKIAWLNARESYGQTEIFRLSNGPIDAESGWVINAYRALEGRINAWPLDESMIDYMINAKGLKTSGNIIDSNKFFTPSAGNIKKINVTNITSDVISILNENGNDENITAGYHAIEFLLWGQDQDYSNFIEDNITKGALTAGMRPLSDYTTDKNSNRRKEYLSAVADLLVNDLKIIVAAWKKEDNANYRAALLGYHKDHVKNIDKKIALSQIFSGMGVFIKSELANERIAIAVLTPSEEDEHSCFSDNTHRDITMNYQGFKNILFGTYNDMNYGTAAIDNMSDTSKLLKLIKITNYRIKQMNIIAQTSRHFDYQIHPNDSQSIQIIKLKNNLRAIGDIMVDIAQSYGVNLGMIVTR